MKNILRKVRSYFRKTSVEKDSFQEFLDLNFVNYRFLIEGDFITFRGFYRGGEFNLIYDKDVQVGTIWLDLEFLIVSKNGKILENKLRSEKGKN